MKKTILKNIVLISVLAAVAVVIEKLSIKIPLLSDKLTLKITFYGLPLILCSLLLGYKNGFLSGFIAAFITQIILSEYAITPTTPLWMVSPIMWGLIPGVIFKLFKNKNNIVVISIIVIITSISVSLFNSLALYLDALIMKYPSGLTFTLIIIRLFTAMLSTLIYIPCIYLLLNRLQKILE